MIYHQAIKWLQSGTQRILNLTLLLSACALLLSWLTPNHYPPWTAFYNDFSATTALLLLASSVYFRRLSGEAQAITYPALILITLAIIPLLQLLSGLIVFSGDAWIATLYLAALALAYVVGYQSDWEFRLKLVETLAWLLLLGCLISLFLALHQWLQLDGLGIWRADLPPNGRPYANLAQPNNLATLFCLGLVAALYLRETGHLGRGVTALLAIVLLAGAALTGSRTPFVVAIVLISWILWSRRRIDLRISTIQIILGLSAFIFFWLLLPSLSDILFQSSATTIVERTQSSLRLVIWAQLFDAAMSGPWFGYGWNQVSFAQIAVAASHPQSGMVEHSHNIVLDLLLWNGVIIGGALIIALSWWMFTRLRHCPTKESWFGLAAIMVVGTHGLLEYPLEYAYFLLPIGLCAGAVDAGYPQRKFKIPGWTLPAVVLIGWIVLVGVFTQYQSIENEYRQMRFQLAKIGPQTITNQTPKPNLFNQLSEYIRYAKTEAKENMPVEELSWMQKLAHRYPYPPALFRYALALGLNHRYDEAGLELLRLKKIHAPNHIEEAVVGWRQLSERYPQLKQVPLP